MRETRTVPASVDFIEQALYDRYDDVKERRWCEIHDKAIDTLVEICCKSWVYASAWSIIDNRLVNWENWTYKDYFIYQMDRNEEEYDEDNEQLMDEIEDELNNEWYFYDRDLKEWCSL